MNRAQMAIISSASSHAALHGSSSEPPPDPNIYITDEEGNLLTDADGNLIVEG